MNRIAKCLCMVAVIALAFTACKKKENDTKVLKFNGATEQLVVVDEELDGRMYIDDQFRVQFDEGDEVAVFNCPTNGTSHHTIYTITDNGATWTGDETTIGDEGVYYAYYPGGEGYVTPDLSNDNRVKFTLMPTQQYRTLNGKTAIPQNALYMASKAEGTTLWTAYFDFKNICGILAMNLYSADPSKRVTRLELTDPSFNLVGDVTLKIDEVDPVEMTSLLASYNLSSPNYVARLTNYMNRVGYQISGNVSKTLTLECPTPVQLGTTAAEATTFYFVLRPLAMRDGCSIKVYFDDNTDATLETQVSHTMHPNHIIKMKPIQVD